MTRSVPAVVLSAHRATQPLVAGLTPAERTRRAFAALQRADGPWFSEPVILFVTADALVEPDAVAALLAGVSNGTAALAAGDDLANPGALALPADEPWAQRLTSTEQLAPCAEALHGVGRVRSIDVGDALCLRVQDRAAAERASGILVARLIRPTDGFLARHFDRHLSRRLSLHLVRHGVSPNVVTVVATLVGLVGAYGLADGHRLVRVVGAALFVFSTILDGCDGEVARLALRCSELGRRLDLLGDNVVNAAVFAGIAVALARGADGGISSAVVWATATGFVVATVTGFVFSNWLARTQHAGERDWYERLTGRDFAYVILGLAIVGRLHWFLWMTAIGCFVFSAAILAYWASLRARLTRGRTA